jgi:hypothetical protein
LLLLFNVLVDIYVLNHGTDPFSYRLIVQVAVGQSDGAGLGEGKAVFFNSCPQAGLDINFLTFLTLVTLDK